LASGNPKRRQGIESTRARAVEALNQAIIDINLGISAIRERQTAHEFITYWSATHVSQLAPKTQRFYDQMCRLYILPTIGHLQLTSISVQHLQVLLDEKRKAGLSPRTVQGIRATIRACLTQAWKAGLIRDNPAARLSAPPKTQIDPVYLTAQEVADFLQACEGHYLKNLFVLALSTGLRLGEATGLTWDDIEWDNSQLSVRRQLQRVNGKFELRPLKTIRSRRALYLTTSATEALQREFLVRSVRMAEHPTATDHVLDLVFTTRQGMPLDPKIVDKALKDLARQAGITKLISFHKLRHTVATHMAASGIPLQHVKDQLGHSQIALTANLYAHAVPTALRKAAEVLEDTILRRKQP